METWVPRFYIDLFWVDCRILTSFTQFKDPLPNKIIAHTLEFVDSSLLIIVPQCSVDPETFCVGAASEDGRGKDHLAGEWHVHWWIDKYTGCRRAERMGLCEHKTKLRCILYSRLAQSWLSSRYPWIDVLHPCPLDTTFIPVRLKGRKKRFYNYLDIPR